MIFLGLDLFAVGFDIVFWVFDFEGYFGFTKGNDDFIVERSVGLNGNFAAVNKSLVGLIRQPFDFNGAPGNRDRLIFARHRGRDREGKGIDCDRIKNQKTTHHQAYQRTDISVSFFQRSKIVGCLVV